MVCIIIANLRTEWDDVLYVGLGGVKEDQVTNWNGVHVVVWWRARSSWVGVTVLFLLHFA